MKYIISLTLICFGFLASATTVNETIILADSENSAIEMSLIGNDRGKKARKNKRVNKKRKRRCGKFSKKGYAG